MPETLQTDVTWAEINDLLRQLREIHGGRKSTTPDSKPSDTALKLESRFLELLQPYVASVSKKVAGYWDWPKWIGDSRDEIAQEIFQASQLILLTTVRHRGFHAGYIKKAFIWRIFRTIWVKSWRHDDQQSESFDRVIEGEEGDILIEPVDPQPAPGDAEHIGEEAEDVRRKLYRFFFRKVEAKRSEPSHRRKIIVLMHSPFLVHGAKEQDDLCLSFGELAQLLGVDNARIAGDRKELGKFFGIAHLDRRIEWFQVTLIGTRLVMSRTPARYFIKPNLDLPDHRRLVELLWSLLRLIQVDGLEKRIELCDKQNGDPEVIFEIGAFELRLSVELFYIDEGPTWAADRVIVHEIRYQVVP